MVIILKTKKINNYKFKFKSNNKEKISTKEFDLYEKQSNYLLQINDLRDLIEEKEQIIEVIKRSLTFCNLLWVIHISRLKKYWSYYFAWALVIIFFIG